MLDKITSKFDWLFSMHYKIERFGVMLFSLLACLGVVVGLSLRYNHEQMKVQLGNQVQYSTTASFSLSGNKVSVPGIYMSTDHTQAFVLLKFDSPAKMVTDVDQYSLFISGSNAYGKYEMLLSRPNAAIYMFGSTGYMGIYLVDGGGFPEQILSMTLRCDTLIGSPMEDVPAYADISFNQYDQATVYFNPGGSAYEPASFLDERRMDIYDIVEATIVDGQEQAIRQLLDDDLQAMYDLQTEMSEYATRLARSGIIVPTLPPQIRDDRIVMDEDGALSLEASYVIPGGFTFDWRNGSVLEGYLDEVLPDGADASRWLSGQSALADKEKFVAANLRFFNSDGTEWSGDNPHALQSITDINNAIQYLQSDWSAYFELKKQYQTDHMAQLLTLELSVKDLTDNYSIRTDDTTKWY